VPILLSPEATTCTVLAAMAPVIFAITTHRLHNRGTSRRRFVKLWKQSNSKGRKLMEVHNAALAVQRRLLPRYRRSVTRERRRGGLLVLAALYYDGEEEEASLPQFPGHVDVTVPLQCMVKRGQLRLCSMRRGSLPGFCTPSLRHVEETDDVQGEQADAAAREAALAFACEGWDSDEDKGQHCEWDLSEEAREQKGAGQGRMMQDGQSAEDSNHMVLSVVYESAGVVRVAQFRDSEPVILPAVAATTSCEGEEPHLELLFPPTNRRGGLLSRSAGSAVQRKGIPIKYGSHWRRRRRQHLLKTPPLKAPLLVPSRTTLPWGEYVLPA